MGTFVIYFILSHLLNSKLKLDFIPSHSFLTIISQKKNKDTDNYLTKNSPLFYRNHIPFFRTTLSHITTNKKRKNPPQPPSLIQTKSVKLATHSHPHMIQHVIFFPPYEEVNIADHFVNVFLKETDRVYIPRDPFIPFDSLSHLETNNIFHSPSHFSAYEEPTYKNPLASHVKTCLTHSTC